MKATVPNIIEKKKRGEKITMLTAYDYSTALIIDRCGVDILLVGDSVGPIFSGYENTLPVTTEEILYHTKAVSRARKNALLVSDMPFLSYQTSFEDAVRNCGLMLKAGAEAVKLEGGQEIADLVRKLSHSGIPVMGHIGLTPQSIHSLGGYKVQGKTEDTRRKLIISAKSLEEAGVFSIVLECVPEDVAKEITENVNIPTIGIGAGRYCDGQVLVINDILGLFEGFRPKFVKKYVDLAPLIEGAVKNYVEDVKTGKFPEETHIFS
ncbi:MAG: 3-methyl-2-oxobutanoate hydroxymethyltransferase [Proteobacteria bacterium]|nr:3-methyl-2-oxobutanoate hydroxymethyltransferase [Pseudomonadota bacterium]